MTHGGTPHQPGIPLARSLRDAGMVSAMSASSTMPFSPTLFLPQTRRRGILVVLLAQLGTLTGCGGAAEMDDSELMNVAVGSDGERAGGAGTGGDATGTSSPVWSHLQGRHFTVISSEINKVVDIAEKTPSDEQLPRLIEEHVIEARPSVCGQEMIDFDCDVRFPSLSSQDCPAGEVLDYREDEACPVCVAPAEPEPGCAQLRRRFAEFLDHNLRETCTGWCETESDCVATEIRGCGITASVALRALVDEEPVLFATSFAEDHCTSCEESGDSAASLLPELSTACVEHQCVIVRAPAR